MPRQPRLIEGVQPLHVSQYMFVRIIIDDNIVGYGEVGIGGNITTAKTAITRFAEYFVDRSAFDIKHY